jgi:hypothetical protein
VIDQPLSFSRAELQQLGPMPALRQHPFQAVAWLLRTGIGIVVLVALLALASAIPIVNVVAMGYLMETQGRVARTGRLRSAIYLVPAAWRSGIALLAVWLFLLPIQFLSGLARDSWLLAPGGAAAWWWSGALVLASILVATHLVLAIGCGAAWWRFFRPINNARWLAARFRGGNYWRDADRAIREFLAAFQFANLFRLGLIGYIAVYFWLVVPTLLFTMLDDVTSRGQLMVFVIGCVTVALTLTWLPLMLAHVAAEARVGAMLELTTVLRVAGRTPFRWALATAILLACSVLPLLYTALFKIRIPPHDARWDLMLVFLLTAIPARIFIGWVYHRARQQPPPLTTAGIPTAGIPTAACGWPWRIWQTLNASALGVGVGYYVYFLYLAQTGGELGQRAVWQYHALLQPLPF